jgi:hypothetical protein
MNKLPLTALKVVVCGGPRAAAQLGITDEKHPT